MKYVNDLQCEFVSVGGMAVGPSCSTLYDREYIQGALERGWWKETTGLPKWLLEGLSDDELRELNDQVIDLMYNPHARKTKEAYKETVEEEMGIELPERGDVGVAAIDRGIADHEPTSHVELGGPYFTADQVRPATTNYIYTAAWDSDGEIEWNCDDKGAPTIAGWPQFNKWFVTYTVEEWFQNPYEAKDIDTSWAVTALHEGKGITAKLKVTS